MQAFLERKHHSPGIKKPDSCRRHESGQKEGLQHIDRLLHLGDIALQLTRPCVAVFACHVLLDGHLGIVLVAVIASLRCSMNIGVRIRVAVLFGVGRRLVQDGAQFQVREGADSVCGCRRHCAIIHLDAIHIVDNLNLQMSIERL